MAVKSKRSWLGAIMGLLFLLAGLAAAYGSAGKMIVGYIATTDWVEVPATIHNVELVSSRSDDSTTYSVKSLYAYNYNGTNYQGSRVSLSTGNDNIGSYWKDLARELRASQNDNEAIALVNPNNPSESLLDRTLRWRAMVFASIFVFIFGGAGIFFLWVCLFTEKSQGKRSNVNDDTGINSHQRFGSWYMAAFGGVFFVMGAGLSAIVLPDALREGEYGALFMLLFVVVGAGIIFYALKTMWAYRKFGPTPLFLNPLTPGVGGQLGGHFDIHFSGVGHAMASTTPFNATLTCTYKRKSGKQTRSTIEWQQDVPVYLESTATGVQASFLFDVPSNCRPSLDRGYRGSYSWDVSVEGDFTNIGSDKFERSWPVIIDQHAAQASDELSIPQHFMDRREEQSEDNAKAAVLADIPISDDGQYISLHSRAGRNPLFKLFGMLMGLIFIGISILVLKDDGWVGYLILLIGGLMAFFSLRSLGRSITVSIDKVLRTIDVRESWFGIRYFSYVGKVDDTDQFKTKLTSTSTTGNKVTEYHLLEFSTVSKTIRLADGIEGKDEALALKQAVVDQIF